EVADPQRGGWRRLPVRVDGRYLDLAGRLQVFGLQRDHDLFLADGVGLAFDRIQADFRHLAQFVTDELDGLRALVAENDGRGYFVEGGGGQVAGGAILGLEQRVEDFAELLRRFVGEHADQGADGDDAERVDHLGVPWRAGQEATPQQCIERQGHRHAQERPRDVPPEPASR